MGKSSMFGRRIHISGSIVEDLDVAPTQNVEEARQLISDLVQKLIKKGANFVIPVDSEKYRESDGNPICFDWMVWESIHSNLSQRPIDAPSPFIIAVQHHKNEEQIPSKFERIWDDLRSSDHVQIENVADWNMNAVRMEMQAKWGEILIVLGGGEGVKFLANLYHNAGKPVIPLNSPICDKNAGARYLFKMGLSSLEASNLFQTVNLSPHNWVNKINFTGRKTVSDRVEGIIDLLEALEPPKAFMVRLLNPEHSEFSDVQNYFDTIVQPVVEGELGYKMIVVDGKQPLDYPYVDQEIFERLHRSSVVFADITGMRPNCFIELGYSLGRGLHTMVMAKKGTQHPFDIGSLSANHWSADASVGDGKKQFLEHWNAIKSRPSLVSKKTLC